MNAFKLYVQARLQPASCTPSVERARLEHLNAVVHLQMSPGSLFTGGPSECFDKSPSSCKLPPTDRYNKQEQDHNRQGGYAETHNTQTVAAEQQDLPATSSLQNKLDDTMYSCGKS